MKRIITLLILFIMVTHGVAVGENIPILTLSNLFNMFDKNNEALRSLFSDTMDFRAEFVNSLRRDLPIKATKNIEIGTFDTYVSCEFISETACTELHISYDISREFESLAQAFIEEAISSFGTYTVKSRVMYSFPPYFIWQDVYGLSVDEIIERDEDYTLSFSNDVSMQMVKTEDSIYFSITKATGKKSEPVGSGFYIGDYYENILNSPDISIISKEGGSITFISQFVSYPSYFQYRFNEENKLTHAYIMVSGCYSLEELSYHNIGSNIGAVYEHKSEYETDNRRTNIYVSYKDKQDSNRTICIHEIKEEEGIFYHTITFLPEDEYNLALFQNYLNN